MGFGFGEENLDLILPIENRTDRRKLYATNTGIAEPRWESLAARATSRLIRTSDPNKQALMTARGVPVVETSNGCRSLIGDFALSW